MTVADLETPAILIDLDILEANLARMADYAGGHGLRLRPHTKTHKIPELGRRQIALGAAGLTVAKTTEAEVMLAAEPPDLLVAYPVLGRQKLERLMKVAEPTRVTVALDSEIAARQLSDAAKKAGHEIAVLAEFDAGLGRVGVAPGDLVGLARVVSSLPGLRFDGITFYPGHIKQWDSAGEAAFQELGRLLTRVGGELLSAGVAPRIVSGGSTPTWFRSHELPELNEIRPGTYIFNDRNTMQSGACTLDQCAARVMVTVVSTAVPGQAIIDGGSKTFSSDPCAGGGVGHGYLPETPGAIFRRMNEEHGYVDITGADARFEIGQRLRVIPNHICVAMNLHEMVYGVRGDQVEHCWKVEGRGKLQ